MKVDGDLKPLWVGWLPRFGVKPIATVQSPRENFWTDSSGGRTKFAPCVLLYGAIEPASREHFFYTFSHLDAPCFNRYIEQFSLAFPETLNLLQLRPGQCSCCQWAEVAWKHRSCISAFSQSWIKSGGTTVARIEETISGYELCNACVNFNLALFAELNALTSQRRCMIDWILIHSRCYAGLVHELWEMVLLWRTKLSKRKSIFASLSSRKYSQHY